MPREKKIEEPVEFHISRSIAAPVASIYKAWTDPSQLAKWWGPKGFTSPVCEISAKEEGVIRIEMTDEAGTIYPMRGIFHELMKNVCLVFSTYSHDDDRKRAGLVNHHTVDFAEEDGITTVSIKIRVVRASPKVSKAVAGLSEGWNESLDRLTMLVGKKG
jgi:uncharacterized protein YndB with AHSA1/START domain